MVQTNQLISQLNVSAKVQTSSKTAKNDDSKSSFSEALGQKLSSKDKATDDSSKELKTNDKEKGQVKDAENKQSKTDETQNVQQESEPQQTEKPVIVDDSWLMQALVMQQPVAEMQDVEAVVQTEELIPQVIDAVDTETVGEEITEMTAVEQMLPETLQSANAVQKTDAKEITDDTNQVSEMKSTVQDAQPVQAAAHTQNSGQQHTRMNSQKESRQPAQTENVNPVDSSAQTVSQSGQTIAEQTNVETPQTAQGQTVDMSNPKEGVPNLAKNMSEQINQGKNAFEIWLEPANLGKIGVKVVYEGGRALVQIMCMSSKAMEIVAQNAKTLGSIIQQNTGNNTLVVVEQPEEQDYLQQEAGKQNRGDEQQEEEAKKDKKQNEEDTETQSFLHQLRLGLK